ncbi:CAP domain-containing protein [Halobacillus sp. Marseille-Q1614]|uniref:CAP domain-containing protein n=1 Tax=Halobacillus sp. Marseille-Q1614 TaxID=2709134 RepID=UPI001570FEFA|nr:CAP domain-containing protein [Halobacillus sp. Marseille-Q1614]
MKKVIVSIGILIVMMLAACGTNTNETLDRETYDYNRVSFGNKDVGDKRVVEDMYLRGNNFPDEGRGPILPRGERGIEEPNANQRVERDNQGQQVLSEAEEHVIELTNEARESQGLEPLSINQQVAEVAQMKSEDMAKNNYFAHSSPTYGSPIQMLQSQNVDFQRAAENIAYGIQTPEEVVDGWMNSPSHRRNILDPNLKEIGVGYVENGHYWTQLFITK